jgi:hypothetical protein
MNVHVSGPFFAAVLLVFRFGNPALAVELPDGPSPRFVALKAVSALFIEHNLETAKPYIAGDAAYRTAPDGSLLTFLEELYVKRPPKTWERVTLDRVIFFSADNLGAVSKEYPDNMWDRVRARIDEGLGVLVVLRISEDNIRRGRGPGADRIEFMAFILQVAQERPRIVYCDDN